MHADGSRSLLTPSADLTATTCGDAVGALESAHKALFASTMSAAYLAHTEGLTQNSSGVALYQNLTVLRDFIALSLPLRQYKHLPGSCWPVRALVYDESQPGAPVLLHSELVNVSKAGWIDLRLPAGEQNAGRYRVELWPAAGLSSREDGIFTSAAWVSSVGVVPTTAVGGGGGSLTFQPGVLPGGESVPVPSTLGGRLAAAMQWQLRYAHSSSKATTGIMTIPQGNWRGVGRDDVGASSAMWDLIRSGYQDTWLNVRFIESISAMLELQAAGLIPGPPVVAAADLRTAKASFAATFGSTKAGSQSGYLSWVGCGRVIDGKSACDGSGGSAHRVPTDIGFVPSLAAALNLDMRDQGQEASIRLFDPVRNAARNENGRFQTNTIPIEQVNVTLWRASSGWKERDSNGFAKRTAESGGDWQIFAPNEPQDGTSSTPESMPPECLPAD